LRTLYKSDLAPLRYTGAVAVVVLWTTMGAGMALTGLGFSDEDPLSYLGTDTRSAWLFTSGMLVSAILLAAFYLFVRRWYACSGSFLIVGFIGLTGQVVAGVVPLSGHGETWHAVHATGGIVVGLSLPVLMWRFAASQERGTWRNLSYVMFWLEVVACIVGVMLSQSMRAPIAEIVPGAGYHLWIIIVTLQSLRTTAQAACT
jgi:hypothetical protein